MVSLHDHNNACSPRLDLQTIHAAMGAIDFASDWFVLDVSTYCILIWTSVDESGEITGFLTEKVSPCFPLSRVTHRTLYKPPVSRHISSYHALTHLEQRPCGSYTISTDTCTLCGHPFRLPHLASSLVSGCGATEVQHTQDKRRRRQS
jgi:hypothetical protein